MHWLITQSEPLARSTSLTLSLDIHPISSCIAVGRHLNKRVIDLLRVVRGGFARMALLNDANIDETSSEQDTAPVWTTR